MTEQMAIIELQQNIDLPFGGSVSDEASEMAIKALEEISLYKQDRLSLIPSDTFEILYEELEQYRALGTVEELRVARDKQVPKKMNDTLDNLKKAVEYFSEQLKEEVINNV